MWAKWKWSIPLINIRQLLIMSRHECNDIDHHYQVDPISVLCQDLIHSLSFPSHLNTTVLWSLIRPSHSLNDLFLYIIRRSSYASNDLILKVDILIIAFLSCIYKNRKDFLNPNNADSIRYFFCNCIILSK
jgi:hypothetical protein